MIGAMGPPGGGRNPITPRFLRHFNVIGINEFSDETMSRIFSNIVTFKLKVCVSLVCHRYHTYTHSLIQSPTHSLIHSHTHFQAENFHPEYHTLGTMLVSATLHVYKAAMANLLPTPAKSHYVFNLRDFARVVLGCLLVKPQSLENKKTFIRLWVHEVYRVYYDRLVDSKDRQWVFELLQVHTHLYLQCELCVYMCLCTYGLCVFIMWSKTLNRIL